MQNALINPQWTGDEGAPGLDFDKPPVTQWSNRGERKPVGFGKRRQRQLEGRVTAHNCAHSLSISTPAHNRSTSRSNADRLNNEQRVSSADEAWCSIAGGGTGEAGSED